MQLAKELFTIPYKGRNLLYAPLEGSVLEVKPGVISFLNQVQTGANPQELNADLTEKLVKSRILIKGEKEATTKQDSCSCSSKIYAPTSVTLLPTYNCNLRCVYCYSRGGEEVGSVMPEEIARAAVDFIVNNAKQTTQKKVSLGFHGGGEPLLPGNMSLVRFATEYIQDQATRNNLKCVISSATNGVFNQETFEWVIKNVNHLGLSLDGPEDIQNAQRPLGKNQPSYNGVIQTIKQLEELSEAIKKNFGYSLRATITSQSVERMPEILEFFTSISKNNSYHLEPLFECGRCSTTHASAPNPKKFLESIIVTQDLAKSLGKEVYYSGATIEKIGETFCGACGSNFFVTPEGYVTTCLEACRPNEKPAEVFFIGKYNPETKKFDFDEDKRKVLSERKVSRISYCEDCFAKYNCSGDCPAKVWEQGGNLNDPSNNWRCQINQGLLAYRLASRLDEEKGKSSKIELKTEEIKVC